MIVLHVILILSAKITVLPSACVDLTNQF